MYRANEQSLFDRLPKCHGHDPTTSAEAAKKLAKSGRLKNQRHATLEALRRCNGATHAELGLSMGVHWLILARRLLELERAGLVQKGKPRICRVKGSRCTAWWVIDPNYLNSRAGTATILPDGRG